MPSSNAWVEPLGWMLIHSVWLIALIVAGAALVMACPRRRSAATRYVSGCVALTLSLATLPATLMWVVVNHGDTPVAEMSGGDESLALIDEHRAENAAEIDDVMHAGSPAGQAQSLATLATAHAPAEIRTMSIGDAASALRDSDASPAKMTFWQRAESRLRPHLPVVVAVWLVGVMLLSSRPLIGWHSARRLQRVGLSEVSDSLKDMLSRLSGRLGLRRAVRLFQSSLVRIPCVVGAFKPVILLPASAITGLSPEQLEALLAHELAHVRRHDFAVNVVQTLVETLLFYHPAIWWLSRRVRQEREHCCDDLAISVCGDVPGYARMLVLVEGLRGRVPQTSVAASGGSLVERVRRLLPSPHEQPRSPWLPGIIVLGALVVLVGSWQWTVGQVSDLPEEEVAVEQDKSDRDTPTNGQVENLPRKDQRSPPLEVIGKIEKPDGSPAAGATVIAVRGKPTATRDARQVVTTNEQGEFTLRLNGVAGVDASWQLSAFLGNDGGKLDDWIVVPKSGSEDESATAPKPPKRVIRLQPGRTVSGTVLHESTQKPIADAKVYSDQGQLVTTDARGRFTLQGLPAEVVPFVVTSPGMVRTRVDVDVSERLEADVEIALVRGGTVRGRVLDPQGRPVANAAVTRWTSNTILDAAMTEITDAEGRFTFDGFPANKLTYPFSVSAVEFCCTSADLLALNGPEDAKEITLRVSPAGSNPIKLLNVLGGDNTPPTGAIRGRAVDQQGRPVRNFTVTLLNVTESEPRDVGSPYSNYACRFTADDGRFVIGRLDADKRYRVAVTAANQARASVEPIYARRGSTLTDRDEVEFRLQPAGQLHVRVLDAETKQPIPNVRVGLKPDDPQREEFEWNERLSGAKTEWTSANGTASFKSLAADEGPIFVEHPGYARQQIFWKRTPNTDPSKTLEDDRIELALQKEARLRIQIRDFGNHDHNDIFARLIRTSTKESFHADFAFDPQRRAIEFRQLPSGTHSLTIHDAASDEPWTPLVTRQLELKPGDTELELELPPPKPKPNPLNEALKEFGASLNRILPQAEKPTALLTDDVRDKEAAPQPPVKTITGRIVDDQDRPVAAARLWWVVTDWIPEGVIVDTASDEQGRFSISTPDVPPPRPSAVNDTLWVLKDGRQLATVPARNGLIVDGKDPGLVIRLEPATDTSFKVVSPDQKPVAGVVVEPLHFRMHMGYGIIPAQARKIMSTKTDAEGKVQLPNMPRKGFRSVHATSEAFGTQQLGLDGKESSPAERTIELRATGRIEGQLNADNLEWIRGVQLWFNTEGDPTALSWEATGSASVITDDQGRFTVPVIAAGRLRIDVRPEKNAPALPRLPDAIVIAAGDTQKLEIALEAPVLVRSVTGHPPIRWR